MQTIYDFYKQSKKNAGKSEPVVVMKRNARDPLVVITLDDFMDLIK